MSGRHASPEPGTDVLMALVIVVLLVLLAAVVALALLRP
jgi:hypothetical protein